MNNSHNDMESVYSQRLRALLTDSGLRDALLPPITGDEQAALEQKFVPVSVASADWCARSPILNPTTIDPLALLTIVPFPDAPIDALVARMKGALWTYAIDDFIDSSESPLPTIVSTVGDCINVAMASHGAERPRTSYGRALAEVRAELSGYPLFGSVHPCWAGSLARLLDAMMFELWTNRRYRGRTAPGPAPTIDEYLYYGRHSIANPHLMTTALVVSNDATVVPALRDLFDLATACAGPLRLSNDLVSYSREEHEGKVNSVALSSWPDGSGRADSDTSGLDEIRKMLRDEQSQAHSLAATVRTASRIERSFVRSMDFCIDLYRARDYRLWKRDLDGLRDPALGAGQAVT